jgi:lysophospholipase L1-like esterase
MKAVRLLHLTIGVGILAAPLSAQASDDHRIDCTAPAEMTRLARPLERVTARLARGDSVTILAIGSSSTEGIGASRTELTYPSRLEAELRLLIPGARIRVLNRGASGEDARAMLGRMSRELSAEKPDLVLWQVGTNALLRYQGINAEAPLIRAGLQRIREAGADAVLIDPQYAPKVLRDPDARPMVALLARVAADAGVPVFHRFALMEHWHQAREIAFAEMLSPDLFHMNDWSYGCFAASLATALSASITQPAREPTSEPAAPRIAPVPSPVTPVSAPR